VARIDAPLLDDVTVTLFNQLVFDTPQFMQFIGRISQFNTLDQADVLFHDDYIKVKFSSRRLRADCKTLVLVVKCGDSDWQLSALAQVFRTPSPPICTLERLDIFDSQYPPKRWQDDTEDAQWLEFLHPFTSVKRLYLSEEVSRRVAPALKKLVGGRVTEVLPVLENIFASGLQPEGRVQKALGRFAAARQVSGHSVAVQHY
jgi:hypothetical protein